MSLACWQVGRGAARRQIFAERAVEAAVGVVARQGEIECGVDGQPHDQDLAAGLQGDALASRANAAEVGERPSRLGSGQGRIGADCLLIRAGRAREDGRGVKVLRVRSAHVGPQSGMEIAQPGGWLFRSLLTVAKRAAGRISIKRKATLLRAE